MIFTLNEKILIIKHHHRNLNHRYNDDIKLADKFQTLLDNKSYHNQSCNIFLKYVVDSKFYGDGESVPFNGTDFLGACLCGA